VSEIWKLLSWDSETRDYIARCTDGEMCNKGTFHLDIHVDGSLGHELPTENLVGSTIRCSRTYPYGLIASGVEVLP
jgi:hypothetical protein